MSCLRLGLPPRGLRCAPVQCPRPQDPTCLCSGGLGWWSASPRSAPGGALHANWALRAGEGGKTLCFAGARVSNLLLSWGRQVLGEAILRQGRRQDQGSAGRSPHGGSETPLVKKGQSAGWGEPPASARCGQRDRGSTELVRASPCLAPRLCGSEVQLSLFSVRLGRPGSRFFYFWKIGLTQHRKSSSGRDHFPLPENRWEKKLGFFFL